MADTPALEAMRQCRDALREAAQSLRTISDNAGKRIDTDGNENYLRDCAQVRGYANSRATVADAALAAADAALSVPALPRWHWSDLQAGAHLPPCDGQRIFVGVNVNGYTCTFNGTNGDNCWADTPEGTEVLMSGLRWWAPYVSPMDAAESITPASLSVQAEPAPAWTVNRYCSVAMCLAGDKQHEPDCAHHNITGAPDHG